MRDLEKDRAFRSIREIVIRVSSRFRHFPAAHEVVSRFVSNCADQKRDRRCKRLLKSVNNNDFVAHHRTHFIVAIGVDWLCEETGPVVNCAGFNEDFEQRSRARTPG